MGFVDLQVNGYAGVDFNSDALTEEELLGVCQRLSSDGVDQILATIITAPMNTMIDRISRIVALAESNSLIANMIGGIHIEGPFLNPADGFIGAHPIASAIPANQADMQRLLDAGAGTVRMVTLAPEFDTECKVTRDLADQGIVVAAGHSDATIDQLSRGIDNGLRLFTHLGNGCPALLPRHDNIVQRVLSLSDRLTVSFIADGHHVPGFALANYLDRVPDENIVIVSDAISAAGLGPGKFKLCDQVVEVDEDGAAWAACRTHYAGCATPLNRMAQWLMTDLGVSETQIQQWFCTNPKKLVP